MRVGTTSLLLGVHQVVWHPITVLLAWRRLYGRWPDWRELVCIVIHDWGYWGKRAMDDEEGERHPEWAAERAYRWWGPYYSGFCYYHSRHYARLDGAQPSKLCWADKLSIAYDPPWFYLFRARLSGELAEYRQRAADAGVVPLAASDAEWLAIIRRRFVRIAGEQKAGVVPYVNPLRPTQTEG